MIIILIIIITIAFDWHLKQSTWSLTAVLEEFTETFAGLGECAARILQRLRIFAQVQFFVDNTSHMCSDKNAKVQKHRNTKQKYKTTLFCTGVSPLMLSPHVFQLLGVYLL